MKAPNEKGAEPASSRAQKVRTNAKSTVHPSKSTPAYGSSTIKRTRRTKNELGCLDGAIVRIVQDQRPMTVRQCFYQGTVHGLVPKDEAKGYRVIQRRLVALRESERIPYGWVTDNIRWVHGYTRYGGVAEFARDVRALYRRDYWRDAPVRAEVWIEKDALASVIAPVVIEEWGLSLHVARGFSSITYLHETAEDLARDGRPAYIYTLTDLDPSGLGIAHDIELKLRAMVNGRTRIHVERLAVTPEQVRLWKLPTRPTKHSDTRAAKFVKQYGNESVELDAIEPNALRKIVGDAIARHADTDAIARMKVVEAAERESIANWQKAMGQAA